MGIFERQYKNNEPLTITGDGKQRRDFTHINDIVSGLLLLKDAGTGDGYCIGNPHEYEINQVAKMFSNNVVYLEERPGERHESEINLTKMKALGWEPKHNLKDYIHSRRKK